MLNSVNISLYCGALQHRPQFKNDYESRRVKEMVSRPRNPCVTQDSRLEPSTSQPSDLRSSFDLYFAMLVHRGQVPFLRHLKAQEPSVKLRANFVHLNFHRKTESSPKAANPPLTDKQIRLFVLRRVPLTIRISRITSFLLAGTQPCSEGLEASNGGGPFRTPLA